MRSILLLMSTLTAAVLAAPAANGQARTCPSRAQDPAVATAKSVLDDKEKKTDVVDECNAAYQQLLATTEKFQKLLQRQPNEVVALERYPILLRKQLEAFQQAHRRVAKEALQSQEASATSAAQKLKPEVPKPPAKTLQERQKATDRTHKTPDLAELRRRTLRSWRDVPISWIARSSQRTETLLKQMSSNLEQEAYDVKQLQTQLVELVVALDRLASPAAHSGVSEHNDAQHNQAEDTDTEDTDTEDSDSAEDH